MAHIELTFKSSQLGKETNVRIMLPNGIRKGEKLPVLYLLHGLSDNETCWGRFTQLEKFISGKNVIVVMPNGDRSFYCDIPDYGNYFTYITKELPDFTESVFPASDMRENRFIAGLSMGGYGALKSAFTYPERYSAAAAFSPVADIRDFGENFPDIKKSVLERIDDVDSQDLFVISEKCGKAPLKPRIYHWCGTEDFMYERNHAFSRLMSKSDMDYTYSETPGGHEWEYWNTQIKNAIEFFGF